MAPKGGTFVFLLIMASLTLAKPPGRMPGNKCDFKDMAKKLMKKCQDKGYPAPKAALVRTIFNNSDVPMKDRTADQPNSVLSTFLKVLHSVFPGEANEVSPSQVDKMTNKMWNCSNLPTMIKLMRNSTEASACYMKAFVAPLSWANLTTESENNMDSDDYDTLLWAAKPLLQDLPSTRMNLPANIVGQNMKKMVKMLKEVYDAMSEKQRIQVVKWVKEQIIQNDFNCTMRPSSDSRSLKRCKPSLKWLNSEALDMMGPYLSKLAPKDVDLSPKEKLCEFFRSAKFKSGLTVATRMNPSLGRKFLQKFQECFTGMEFAEHVDKLGTLACHFNHTPELTPDLSRKLLSQLDNCDDPRSKRLKKHLIKRVMSNSSVVQELHKIGSIVTLLSPKQLSTIPSDDLKGILQNLGPTVNWTRGQLRTLVKKMLGKEKCKRLSHEELMALQSIAEGLPRCVLKHVKAKEILGDSKGLKNISKRMSKGQLVAMLQGLREDADPSELVQKLPDYMLQSLSLNNLDKANITSSDQVMNKVWNRAQAAFLAKKLHDRKQLKFRRLWSLLQGITCKMIDRVADSESRVMAQAMTETPQWLSKVQAGCAARKLFSTLVKERDDYFKTITEEEMDEIPTVLLLHLPPSKVKDLPDSVCPAFLDKMETATLSTLPLRAPSRTALINRALLCLTNGTDLFSGLTTEDVLRLGPLLCGLQPSQLNQMVPDVLSSSLQAMASCQHIPRRHRADLIQLLNHTFGDPSEWSAETMEALGPLLLLDDDATSALPNKPWMKDVLYFLKSSMSNTSDTLKKKLFNLTTTKSSNAARKKRAANKDGNGKSNGNSGDDTNSNSGSSNKADVELTEELIEELGISNVHWTAAQLDHMSAETFHATVETLGSVSDYRADQLAVLTQKATETFGPVSQMTGSMVVQMRCITQGFSSADLEKLPISLDNVEDLVQCGWTESQVDAVWKGVAKYNNLTAEQLGAAEMVDLNRFICGLNSSEMSQLSMDAFKDAVGSIAGIQCSFKATQQLKNLAVSVFGDPSTWTEAQVSDLGNIIAGLSAAELASLDPSVLAFLSQSSVPLIPPDNFASLSVAQLGALGPDNAAMVTSEQRAVLRDEQRAILETAMSGSRAQTQNSDQSGAPSLSVEGISAVMKPLLFLLTGFLLL